MTMKILHCCLAAFYIDNYGYQENILPKFHKLQGHEVRIVASTETYIENIRLGYVSPNSYYTSENISITRIPYTKLLPHFVARKLRIYKGLSDIVEEFDPDIIFLHDTQFVSIREIARFARHKSIRIYADCHTDFTNSARNWFSRNILHKLIYRWCAWIIEPYTSKFYGVLPIRVDFLREVYKISDKKLDLLVLGADDTQFDLKRSNEIREIVRQKYKIDINDFVVVSGGKIDERKNIHILMESFRHIEQNNIKLIIFGSICDNIKDEVKKYESTKNIILLGWLSTKDIYELLIASDLGFFPGTHSVIWEQSVGVGLPCVFKKWKGIQHVDVAGNCMFIEEISPTKISALLLEIVSDKTLYGRMKEAAVTLGVPKFSYSKISQYAIEQG